MCDLASIVAIGTVESSHSAWEQIGDANVISTEATVRVEQTIYGAEQNSLQVYVLGGEVDGLRMGTGSMPVLKEGRRFLFFLYDRGANSYTVLHDGVGAIQLDPNLPLPELLELQAIFGQACGL